jgi:hypothetical protein
VEQAREGHGNESRLSEKLEIVEVVQNWALWRDAGDWERFAGVWLAGAASAFPDEDRPA